MKKKAVILLSGGLDTAACLALASTENYDCYALSFDYQQKHRSELKAAEKIAAQFAVVEHKTLVIPKILGSALTEVDIQVPENRVPKGITTTYVPARNTIFLSYALAWAEYLKAQDIFYGANAADFLSFPDCRLEYVKAFEQMANLATKQGVEAQEIKIHAPLLNLSKAEIIKLAMKLGVNPADTVTCYQADEAGRACGSCDSCRVRHQGFIEVGMDDPTVYYS